MGKRKQKVRWTSVEDNFFGDDSGSESAVSSAPPNAKGQNGRDREFGSGWRSSSAASFKSQGGRRFGGGGHLHHHWGSAPIAPRFERRAAQAAAEAARAAADGYHYCDREVETEHLPDGFTKIRSKNLDVLFKKDYYAHKVHGCYEKWNDILGSDLGGPGSEGDEDIEDLDEEVASREYEDDHADEADDDCTEEGSEDDSKDGAVEEVKGEGEEEVPVKPPRRKGKKVKHVSGEDDAHGQVVGNEPAETNGEGTGDSGYTSAANGANGNASNRGSFNYSPNAPPFVPAAASSSQQSRPNLFLYSPSSNTMIPCEEIIIPNPVMGPEGPMYPGPSNIYLAFPVEGGRPPIEGPPAGFVSPSPGSAPFMPPTPPPPQQMPPPAIQYDHPYPNGHAGPYPGQHPPPPPALVPAHGYLQSGSSENGTEPSSADSTTPHSPPDLSGYSPANWVDGTAHFDRNAPMAPGMGFYPNGAVPVIHGVYNNAGSPPTTSPATTSYPTEPCYVPVVTTAPAVVTCYTMPHLGRPDQHEDPSQNPPIPGLNLTGKSGSKRSAKRRKKKKKALAEAAADEAAAEDSAESPPPLSTHRESLTSEEDPSQSQQMEGEVTQKTPAILVSSAAEAEVSEATVVGSPDSTSSAVTIVMATGDEDNDARHPSPVGSPAQVDDKKDDIHSVAKNAVNFTQCDSSLVEEPKEERSDDAKSSTVENEVANAAAQESQQVEETVQDVAEEVQTEEVGKRNVAAPVAQPSADDKAPAAANKLVPEQPQAEVAAPPTPTMKQQPRQIPHFEPPPVERLVTNAEVAEQPRPQAPRRKKPSNFAKKRGGEPTSPKKTTARRHGKDDVNAFHVASSKAFAPHQDAYLREGDRKQKTDEDGWETQHTRRFRRNRIQKVSSDYGYEPEEARGVQDLVPVEVPPVSETQKVATEDKEERKPSPKETLPPQEEERKKSPEKPSSPPKEESADKALEKSASPDVVKPKSSKKRRKLRAAIESAENAPKPPSTRQVLITDGIFHLALPTEAIAAGEGGLLGLGCRVLRAADVLTPKQLGEAALRGHLDRIVVSSLGTDGVQDGPLESARPGQQGQGYYTPPDRTDEIPLRFRQVPEEEGEQEEGQEANEEEETSKEAAEEADTEKKSDAAATDDLALD